MFNLDALAHQFGEKLRPHAETVQRTLTDYGESILSRLDAIVENTKATGWLETRRWVHMTLTADTEADLTDVKVGHQSEVSTVIVYGAGTVTITTDGVGVFAKQFTAPDTVSPGSLLRGGEDVKIVSTGNAAPMRVSVELTERRPRDAAPATSAGRPEYEPPLAVDETTPRHVQTDTHPAPNIAGPGALNA